MSDLELDAQTVVHVMQEEIHRLMNELILAKATIRQLQAAGETNAE